jgi:hypothetical protein
MEMLFDQQDYQESHALECEMHYLLDVVFRISRIECPVRVDSQCRLQRKLVGQGVEHVLSLVPVVASHCYDTVGFNDV